MNRLSLLVSSVVAFACGPGPTTEGPKPSALTQASVGDLTVELLTTGPLTVGQNRVFYRVTKAGKPAPHAHLKQRPVMHMKSMTHSCPLKNPSHEPNAAGLFEGLIVFTMATMSEEHWTLSADVALESGETPVKVDFGAVAVADSPLKKVVTRDGKKIVLTLGFPNASKVGANDVVVTAHQATDPTMMSFATVDDLDVSATPEMPSMGHGSNGNVKPTRGEDGLYRGKVVFSMPGDWVVHLGVRAGDVELGTFDFSFDL